MILQCMEGRKNLQKSIKSGHSNATLEDLKFVKSRKLSENGNLNPFSEITFLKVYKHMIFRSEFAHKLLIYALITTFYFPLIYALIIRGGNGG